MQEIRDKQTGWKPPDAPGSGKYKYNRITYAKVRCASDLTRKKRVVVEVFWDVLFIAWE